MRQTGHQRSNTAIDVPHLDSGVKISTYPGKPSKSRLDLRDQPPHVMTQRDLPPIRKLPNPVHRKSSVRDLQKISPEEELSDSDQTENNQLLYNQTGRSSEYSVITLSDVPEIPSAAPNRTAKVESQYQKTVSIVPPPKAKLQKESNLNCPPYAHNRPIVPRCSVSRQLISACVYTSSKFGQLDDSRQNPEHTPWRREVDAEVQGNKSRRLGGRTIIEATVPVTGSALDYIPTPIALPSKSSAISRKTQPRLNTGFEETVNTEKKQQVSTEILEMLPQNIDMKELTEINTMEFGFAVLNDQIQHWLHIPPPLDVEITPSYEEDDVSDASPRTKAEENMRKYIYSLISQPFSAATACLRIPNPLIASSKSSIESSNKDAIYQQPIKPPHEPQEPEESREAKITEKKSGHPRKQNNRAHSVPVSFKESNSSTCARGNSVLHVQENLQEKLVSARVANFLAYEGFERNMEDLQVTWAKWTTSKIPRFCAEASVASLEKEAFSQTLRVAPSLYCAVRDRFIVRRLAGAVAEHRDVVEQSLMTAGTSEERQKESQVVLRSMRGIWKLCLWEWDQRVKQNYEKRRSLDEMSNEIMKLEKAQKKDDASKLDIKKEKKLIAKRELLKQQDIVRSELMKVRKSTMDLVEKSKKMKSQLMSQTFRIRLKVLESHFDESEDAPAQALRILFALKSPNPSQKLSSSIRRFTNSSFQDEEFVQVPLLGTPAVSVNSTPRPIRPAGESRR
eukprot:GHVP01056355.1.p1 GENE.GHVP01056355.1~~GHVP01056355.1.p1  ORF type:complete len:736 (+),score=159.22 GHVP01056355.1:1245-3452(+)